MYPTAFYRGRATGISKYLGKGGAAKAATKIKSFLQRRMRKKYPKFSNKWMNRYTVLRGNAKKFARRLVSSVM